MCSLYNELDKPCDRLENTRSKGAISVEEIHSLPDHLEVMQRPLHGVHATGWSVRIALGICSPGELNRPRTKDSNLEFAAQSIHRYPGCMISLTAQYLAPGLLCENAVQVHQCPEASTSRDLLWNVLDVVNGSREGGCMCFAIMSRV